MLSNISGEFGIVYKGHMVKGHGQSVDEYLAVKTLKGNTLPTLDVRRIIESLDN